MGCCRDDKEVYIYIYWEDNSDSESTESLIVLKKAQDKGIKIMKRFTEFHRDQTQHFDSNF